MSMRDDQRITTVQAGPWTLRVDAIVAVNLRGVASTLMLRSGHKVEASGDVGRAVLAYWASQGALLAPLAPGGA